MLAQSVGRAADLISARLGSKCLAFLCLVLSVKIAHCSSPCLLKASHFLREQLRLIRADYSDIVLWFYRLFNEALSTVELLQLAEIHALQLKLLP